MKKVPPTTITDSELNTLLKTLPNEQASADFLSKTLNAAELRATKQPWFPKAALVVAMFCTGFLLSWFVAREKLGSPSPTELQHDSVVADLEELKRMTHHIRQLNETTQATTPVIRLGTTPQKEVVIDLRSLANATGDTTYANFKTTTSF